MPISRFARLRSLLADVGVFRLLGCLLMIAAVVVMQQHSGINKNAVESDELAVVPARRPARPPPAGRGKAIEERGSPPVSATDLLRSANKFGLGDVSVSRSERDKNVENGLDYYRIISTGSYENFRVWMAHLLNAHSEIVIEQIAFNGAQKDPGSVKANIDLIVPNNVNSTPSKKP